MKSQPTPGRWEKTGRSPRTSGAPFLAEKDFVHGGMILLLIFLGRARIHGQIVDSADILLQFYHLRGSSVSLLRQPPGHRVGFKSRRTFQMAQTTSEARSWLVIVNQGVGIGGTDHPLITQQGSEVVRTRKDSRRKTESASRAREHEISNVLSM